jgi:integrase
MLPKKTLEILREYYRVYKSKEWLFVTKIGAKMTDLGIQDSWKSIVRKSGIPKHITLHNRHTNASLMLQYNVPAKVASQRLGHSSIGITLDLYSHVIGDMQTEAANKLNNGIFKKSVTMYRR